MRRKVDDGCELGRRVCPARKEGAACGCGHAQADRSLYIPIRKPYRVNKCVNKAGHARFCHGSILVIRSGETVIEAAQKSKELLENAKGKLLGVVLNQKKQEKGEYFY